MPTLSFDRYLDRVLGSWLGAFAGAALGAGRAGTREPAEVGFDPKRLARSGPQDVTDLAVLGIHALRERGPHLNARGLAEEWQQHFPSTHGEFGIARRNRALGVPPPASGRYNNEFFGESISAAARAFVWGLVCAGSARSAVRYARRDAELDHFGEGLEAALFVAALVAEVFFESDIVSLAHRALHQVESSTRLERLVRDVLRWSEEHDLPQCLARVRARYGAPDSSRALVNLGLVLSHWLGGGGDFERVVLGVAGCGHDAVRNGALAGAVAGAMAGATNLPSRWRKALGEEYRLGLESGPGLSLGEAKFSTLAEITSRLGLEIGSVLGTGVEFTQVPSRVTVLDHNPLFVRVMDLFVDYGGAPALRFGEARPMRLRLVSRNPRRMSGILRLEGGADLVVRPEAVPLDLGPHEARVLELKVAVAEGAKRLAQYNPITVRFQMGKETLWTETFGVPGAVPWLALGPFWQAVADGGLARSGFAEKWLPEPHVDERTRPTRGTFFERVVIHADGDVVPLDAAFPPTGPATAYLVATLYSPRERKARVWLGCNDSARLWVNGRAVVGTEGPGFFTPFSATGETRLRKGANVVLVKVGRSDRHFALRVGWRDAASDTWLTDLSYGRLEP